MKKLITALALIITCASCQKSYNCSCRTPANDSGYVAKSMDGMDKKDAEAACQQIDLNTPDSCYLQKHSSTF